MSRPLTPESIASICEHMNEDHADALVTYARVFGHRADARTARMTGMDADGLDMHVETDSGEVDLRVTFDHTLADADDAQQTLIRMARAGSTPGPVV
jgi:putative heme iron utilization protein